MSSKKQSTKTTPGQAAPTSGVNHETRPEWGKLPEVQQEYAELAADMIQNGGHSDDVQLLLLALSRHEYRRKLAGHSLATKEVDSVVTTWMANGFRRLARHWPEPESTTPETAQPTTVADMIKSNYRKNIRREFEEFMAKTNGLETILLLADILNSHNAGFELGESFAFVLDNSYTYLKVPSQHRKRIEAMLHLLTEEATPAAA